MLMPIRLSSLPLLLLLLLLVCCVMCHLVEVNDLKQCSLEEAAGHHQVQQTLVQQVLSSLQQRQQ
jgi:hypothetical protein